MRGIDMGPLDPVNILLVDDRPDGLLTLEAVLRSPEHKLIKASSGPEAIACVQRDEFAVILLDVQMPGMDGFETAAQIKERSRGQVAPILFVTAIHKDPFYIYQGYNAGAVDYIFKPFDPGILRSKVAVLVNLFRQQQEIKRQALELHRKEQELFQSRKLEAVGRLAGGVAHDFNNLITGILGLSHDLWTTLDSQDSRRDDLEEIIKASNRALGLTKQLLAFGRRQITSPQVLDLNGIISDMMRMLQRLITEDIELQTTLETQLLTVRVDQGQVEQILMNLVLNARDAMPRGGKLTIATYKADVDSGGHYRGVPLAPGPYAIVEITDTGCGMDPRTLEHIFEPYYTTKEKDKGTGLGLATVYGIVMQCGGQVHVESQPNEGTTFRIFFPHVAGSPGAVWHEPFDAKARGGKETILVVEDEPIVRQVTTRILRKAGYSVFEAQDAREALEVSAKCRSAIDLLITDVVMPGMNGRQLAEALAPVRSKMAVLYMSGYSEDVVIHHGIVDAGLHFIEKTFTAPAFLSKVREVLDARVPAKKVLDQMPA